MAINTSTGSAFHLGFGVLLASLIAATVAIYWLGLTGPFLFDDYSNLRPMGNLGGANNLTGC